MSLPTFVIAGAQKSGTSTLHRMLRDHPQIFMSRPKEIHFFDRHWDRGLDWYEAHFSGRRRRHVHAGESTPTYMYRATSRQRMVETLPDARLVVILRDPVARAYSHYWHSRRLGTDSSPTFEGALELEGARPAAGDDLERSRFGYVDRGHYIDQVVALEEALGRERLHVILLDELIAHRTSTLEGLFSFLEVAVEPAARIQERRANRYREVIPGREKPKPAAYPPIEGSTRDRLAEHYQPYNDRLTSWLGRSLGQWSQPG